MSFFTKNLLKHNKKYIKLDNNTPYKIMRTKIKILDVNQ